MGSRLNPLRACWKAAAWSTVTTFCGLMLMAPAVEAAVLQSKSYEYDGQGRVIQEIEAVGRFASGSLAPGEPFSDGTLSGTMAAVVDSHSLSSCNPLLHYSYAVPPTTAGVAPYEVLKRTAGGPCQEGYLSISATWSLASPQNPNSPSAPAAGAPYTVTRYTYDDNGNRLTRTDGLNHTTTYAYDELNRVSSSTDPASGTTQYGYDARDNLVSVTDPRNLTTTYTYNGFNQLTAQSSPDTGTASFTPNKAGQVTARTNAASQQTQYVYDALGRVTQATYAGGRVVTYTYDQGTNGKGRLTTIADSESAISWTYDGDGHVLTRTQTIGSGGTAQTSVISYQYNSAGQRTQMTQPSGAVLSYTYDNQGRVQSLSRNGQAIVSGLQYRPFGGLTSLTWGNGQIDSRAYDQNGRLDLLSVGSTVHAVGYDAVSRITTIQDLANSNLDRSFSYDVIDRLTGYTGQNSTRSWNYDAVGNRTQQTIGSTTETYVYANTSNRLQSLTNSASSAQNRSYQYTTTGHTSTDGVNSYSYDARERLVSATTPVANATYTINPLGQRIKKSVTQSGVTTVTTFVYDEAGHLVAENDSAGNSVEYIWLGDMPVAVNKANTQTTQGTAVVVDPGVASGTQIWETAATPGSNYYGSSFFWKTVNLGAPLGVVIDNVQANNTTPSTFTKTTTAVWDNLSPNYQSNAGSMLARSGQVGVRIDQIIDNTSASFSSPGYSAVSCAGCVGGTFHSIPAQSSMVLAATATWSFSISVAGDYQVSVKRFGNNPHHYTINAGSNTYSVTLTNGLNESSSWVSLGTFTLPTGTSSVVLDNVTTANTRVTADALAVGAVSSPLSGYEYGSWTTSLSTAGNYNVYAKSGRYEVGSGATTSAHYTVNSTTGDSDVFLNQQNNQGNWQLLGSYNFNAGTPYIVSLRDESPVGKAVLFDAILFAKPDAPLSYFNNVTWTPTLPATGNYEVQAWWPNQSTAASSTVWFDVTTSSGVSRVVKDQTQQTGQWVSLGQFNLNPATAKVVLLDYGVAGKRVYADAVRFIPTTTTTTSALYYVHPDHLNTPRQITTSDAANTVVWRWDSEPFGNTLPDQDPDQNSQALSYNLRFPGQYYDAETKLSYNYYRDYDPSTGRYLASDPVGLKGGLNTYSYVSANPNSYTDQLGLAVGWTGKITSAGATLGIGGQLARYELESECKCNKKVKVKGFASFLSLGIGATVLRSLGDMSGTSGSAALLDEWADCPDASAPNGPAWQSGINLVVGAGGTVLPSWILGRLRSSGVVDGPSYGVDVSINSTLWGQSVVTSSEVIECCKR